MSRRAHFSRQQDFYSQAAVWWGPNTDVARYRALAATLERLCGPGRKRVLDLGSGPGGIAAAMADDGNDVVAVEFSDRARFARELAVVPRQGSMTVIQDDFYTVELDGRFDVVTCWDGFGLGSDADQLRLLGRIASDWLESRGHVLLELYNPAWFSRAAGTEEVLPPLAGVPGSVQMLRRCHFDAVGSRWIDEWVPTAYPERALAQVLRCYSPADLHLLVEGTGLAIEYAEVDGRAFDTRSDTVSPPGPLADADMYLARLRYDVVRDRWPSAGRGDGMKAR